MKTPILLALLCLPIFCLSQISFQEVNPPDDFSLFNVRKSPTGEYFTQAYFDLDRIYTSTNGTDWVSDFLPDNVRLGNMDFYADGTPIIRPENNEHLIRRNGSWQTIGASTTFSGSEATFLKEDTLFIYKDEIFGYSLDKGETFTTLFESNENIIDHSSDLFKFDNHFVLHHTAGASDYLSVFDQQGNLVLSENMSIGIIDLVHFSDCGELLFASVFGDYYLLDIDALELSSGDTDDIHPDFYSRSAVSQGGSLYLKDGDTIFKKQPCSFDWETLITDEVISTKYIYWIDIQENILLYDSYADNFTEQLSGTNSWEENTLEIDYAFITDIDEVAPDRQACLTPNALFNKTIATSNWSESTNFATASTFSRQIQYSPDGDLYINHTDEIFHSTDNGLNFTSIDYPIGFFGYMHMYIVDDETILLLTDIGDSYYSIDNGQTWNEFFVFFPLISPDLILTKKINNNILIAEASEYYEATIVNTSTNEVNNESIADFFGFDYTKAAIWNDGTIHFYVSETFGQGDPGLYRYKPGEGTTFVGTFPDVANLNLFGTSGDDLYAIGTNSYFKYNGVSFTEYNLSGLPSFGYSNVFLSTNEYLYVIKENHRIFRSTQPLAEKQFIIGSVFHDENSDCNDDVNDDQLPYWRVTVENDNHLQMKTTNGLGTYRFSVPLGEYTVTSTPVTSNWELCESSFDININQANAEVQQDFIAKPLVACAGLELDFSTPRLRRCFDNYYAVRVRNNGPIASDGTTLTLELDPFFDFLSSSIPVDQISNSILEFDLGVIEVGEQVDFKIYFNLNCDAELGEEHCLTGNLTELTLCDNAKPEFTECQVNIGAFDPNDKRIFNEQGMQTTTVDKDEFIYYHIRFQNTGTDTAFTVRVVDTLSSILDIRTFEMLSASHNYEYSLDGPELVVLFEDIMLPDSFTNEPASNGYFKFKIKPLPEFDYGTEIPNTASIYFDFNEAIVTNNAITLIQKPVGVYDPELLSVRVFPNPGTDYIGIKMAEKDRALIETYEIKNQLGQIVTSQEELSDQDTLSISELAPGVYYLLLKRDGNTIGVSKFVKM